MLQVQPQLSICVVNYSGEERLPSCLDALLAHGAFGQEILVVDNASTDRSIALVEDRYPAVTLLAQGENLGPAAARNAGYVRARYDRILFIDNDVIVASNAIASLGDALNSDQRAAFAMPRLCYLDHPETIQYDGAGSGTIDKAYLLRFSPDDR